MILMLLNVLHVQAQKSQRKLKQRSLTGFITIYFHFNNYVLPFLLSFRQAKLYIKGDKHFCSIAADDKLALIGKVDIPANDARSVAVPIVPKRIGEIQVQVSSILQIKIGNSYLNSAGDAVIRTLLVVVCVL